MSESKELVLGEKDRHDRFFALFAIEAVVTYPKSSKRISNGCLFPVVQIVGIKGMCFTHSCLSNCDFLRGHERVPDAAEATYFSRA